MSEKTAKITRTVFKNEWKGQNGTVFYHDIELDNGDKGSIGCKDQMPAFLNPGQELAYTIETTDKGVKIKKATPSNGGGFGGAKKPASNASFAISYAKDLVIASWNAQQFSSDIPKLKSDDLFLLAKKMFDWMEERK